MKRSILMLLLSLFVPLSLFALSAHDIYYADSVTLRNMAGIRGLDASLPDEELRSSLYSYEGLESYTERVEEEGTYSITVNSAENLSTDGSIITLRGNVSLSFSNNGNDTVLSSDEVVIDTSAKLISALGDVSFSSQGDRNSQEISADIVTYYWEKGNIVVENATTVNERTNSNDETINMYSVGERLTYFENGAAIYEDGYIATSASDPLSSISASSITMLPGSDMLIENAVINIGRVPLFYLPLFFYPGSRITGNPSFGFNSSNGAFLNTTFEIFGSSDRIESADSSFLSVFTGTNDAEGQVPRGSYYMNDENLTPLEEWASSSGSHLAVMADAYSALGLHAGVDSSISLLDKSLKFDTFSGIALTYPDASLNSGNIRYYSENSASYSYSGLVISLSAPFYSDSEVLKDFGNRLTAFSIEPLLMQNPSFPSNFSSSITSFSRIADIRYSLPSSLQTDFLSSFSISRFRIESRHSWSRNSDGEYGYLLDYINLPELAMNLSGSIFNFTYEDSGVDESELDSADLFLLKDPLLYDMFHSDIVREGGTSSSYSIGMGYSINESLENNIDYYRGERDSSSFSNESSLRLTTELDLGEYFNLRSIITPSYTYESSSEGESSAWTDDFTLTNSIVASIPFIGLTYTLTNSLYEIERINEDDSERINESFLSFDRDHVSAHSIALSKTFDTSIGAFTPSLSYTIYPLTGSLTPSFSYRIGDFAASFSYRFLNDGDSGNSFMSDLISLSLAYNGKNIVASSSFRYQSSDYVRDNFIYPLEVDAQFSLRTEDRRYSITEQLEWDGHSTATGLDNYVSSLRTVLTVPYFTSYVDFNGPFNDLSLSTVNATLRASDIVIRGWKNRIYLSLGIESSLKIDVQNIAASSFSITPSIVFSIAEFLDFRLSFTSGNNNFGAYESSGKFSFKEMWDDLLRSFDLFGEGRYNTNFNMSSLSFEVVHYMSDWELHCNYSTSVVLSQNVYTFVPEFSIYLSWNILPDLSIDRSWEQYGNTWRNN